MQLSGNPTTKENPERCLLTIRRLRAWSQTELCNRLLDHIQLDLRGRVGELFRDSSDQVSAVRA